MNLLAKYMPELDALTTDDYDPEAGRYVINDCGLTTAKLLRDMKIMNFRIRACHMSVIIKTRHVEISPRGIGFALAYLTSLDLYLKGIMEGDSYEHPTEAGIIRLISEIRLCRGDAGDH